jgi:voltage-gated potassium channel Kch
MALWAGLFLVLGEFPTFETAFYHSVVNFTTLGYGDVVMSEEKRLLGALEAANGVLMIGLTSAFLFSILYQLMERQWNTRIVKTSDSN